MKTLLLTSLMLVGTSNVFAQSLTCNLDILLADKAGYLMPSEEKLSITTKIVKTEKLSLKKCEKIKRQDLKISLCATEADFIGGIDAALIINTNNDEDFPTVSTSVLAPRRDGQGLITITGLRAVLNSFNDKLQEVGIATQVALEYDSASLDDSVKEGFTKGILTANEPVVISIGECLLSK